MNDDEVMKVVSAVEEANLPEDNIIKLSTGVVLKGRQANPLILMQVMAAFPRPKPPVWKSPTMGREMENPDDPDYIERVRDWKVISSVATLNALILLGTELVKVPKGTPKHTDDEWLEEYSLLGIQMHPESKSWRYLTWVMFKASVGNDDLGVIQKVVGRLSGVPEKDVRAAEEFPGSNKDTG